MTDHVNKERKQYCRKVGRRLICKRKTKKRLLSGLSIELTEKIAAKPAGTPLCQELEAPEAVAALLQESVSAEEYQQSLQWKKRLPYFILFLIAVILVALTAIYIRHLSNHDIAYYTAEIHEEPQSEASTEIIWGPIE